MSTINSQNSTSTVDIYNAVLRRVLDFIDLTREQTIKLIDLLQQRQDIKNPKNGELEYEMVDAAQTSGEDAGAKDERVIVKPVFFSPPTPYRIDRYHAFITDCPSPHSYTNLIKFQNAYQSFSLETDLDSSDGESFPMETFNSSGFSSFDNETCSSSRENNETGVENNRRWSQQTLVNFTLPSDESHDDDDTYHLKDVRNEPSLNKKEKFHSDNGSSMNSEVPACKEISFLNFTNYLKKVLHNTLSHNQSGKTTYSSQTKTSTCNYKPKRNSLKNKKLRKVSSFCDIQLLDVKRREGKRYDNGRESSFEEDSEDESTLIDLDEYAMRCDEENEKYFVMDSQRETVGLIDFNSIVDNQKISEDNIEDTKWLFNFYDKDNDGLVTLDEVGQIMYEICN